MLIVYYLGGIFFNYVRTSRDSFHLPRCAFGTRLRRPYGAPRAQGRRGHGENEEDLPRHP